MYVYMYSACFTPSLQAFCDKFQLDLSNTSHDLKMNQFCVTKKWLRPYDFLKWPVLASRGVKGLYEVGGVAEEHGVAGGPTHHAQHR